MRYSSERTLPTHQKKKELTRRDSTTGPAPAHLRCPSTLDTNMKKVTTIIIIAMTMVLTSCVMIPHKSEVGFTPWIDGQEYQDVFDQRSRNLYPIVVEAKLADKNEVHFRAYYVEIPDGPFWFWSNHGISTKAFDENNRKNQEDGFALIHHQALNVASRTIHQATWAKQK
jgi:hypothetical protein